MYELWYQQMGERKTLNNLREFNTSEFFPYSTLPISLSQSVFDKPLLNERKNPNCTHNFKWWFQNNLVLHLILLSLQIHVETDALENYVQWKRYLRVEIFTLCRIPLSKF